MGQGKVRVALLFGGRSGEHAISAATAAGVLAAIDREKYDVIPVGITREGRWVVASDDPAVWELRAERLPEVTAGSGSEVVLAPSTEGSQLQAVDPGSVPAALGEVDVVFPVLHGPYGEDGTVQGLLEMAGIPYVGSGVFASAAAMDKQHMKALFRADGLPVGRYAVLRPGDPLEVYGVHRGRRRKIDYTVTGVRAYHKTNLPYRQIFDQHSVGRLAIITCGGPFDASTGNYLDNILTYAVPS